MDSEDPRLERLYDYTKFHIGIYIVAATTMITVAGTTDTSSFLSALVQHRWLLLAAIGAMLIAGGAGGVLISSCATAARLKDVWDEKIGPWGKQWIPGYWWARIEHFAFWSSVLLFAAAVLWPGGKLA